MKWVTRERCKTDSIASPWSIRRFIDPKAELRDVSSATVLALTEREGGHGFGVPDATFAHEGTGCSLETLIVRFVYDTVPSWSRHATR
jgi:hypothetical protein